MPWPQHGQRGSTQARSAQSTQSTISVIAIQKKEHVSVSLYTHTQEENRLHVTSFSSSIILGGTDKSVKCNVSIIVKAAEAYAQFMIHSPTVELTKHTSDPWSIPPGSSVDFGSGIGAASFASQRISTMRVSMGSARPKCRDASKITKRCTTRDTINTQQQTLKFPN